ncbi:MAG: hypothetical protein WAV05_12740 [Anaerolineales bacterium]
MEWGEAESITLDMVRKKEELSWEKWAKRLDKYLNTLENLFSPDLMILGGGVVKKQENFIPLLKLRTKVIPALMGNDAGIIGAALAAKGYQE